MTALPVTASRFNVDAFSEWIDAQGWPRAGTTNEWEILRYKSVGGWNIVYRTKKGGITWTGNSREDYRAFLAKPKRHTLTGNQRKAIREKLFTRDGCACWYCIEFFTESDFATIEHLVPQSDGGGHQLANLVLAHESCNQLADSAPLARKIELRDRFLAERKVTPPWETIRKAA